MKPMFSAKPTFILLALSFATTAQAAWLVQTRKEAGKVHARKTIHVDREDPEGGPLKLRSIPTYLREDQPPQGGVYEETLYPESAKSKPEAQAQTAPASWPGSEVRAITVQGPKENRINLPIVGDGYTAAEKEKFFEDAKRITNELFGDRTFQSYLPLFNVYAVFVPSQDSGLSDVVQKNTALGLYRDPKGSKRAIMPGNEMAIDRAIALAPASDYPILLANDDFYGGLGGKYATTTRSPRSGIIVLRHELGHNFGEVGEEYDGGYVYSGANSYPSADVPWKSWVNGRVDVYETKFLSGAYVWQNLGDRAFRAEFNFPQGGSGGAPEFDVLLSTVGWDTPGDVEVSLDGKQVEIHGDYTADRSFFTISADRSLSAGRHTLEIREKIHDGNNVLAFAQVYAQPAGYDRTVGKHGAYATFNDSGERAGYRPTHATCLMRDMKSKDFCAVDKQNMWIRFLNRISLIDDLAEKDGIVTLKTPPLPGLDVRWFKTGTFGKDSEETRLAGQTTWKRSDYPSGNYKARVSFRTAEVRDYTKRFDTEKSLKGSWWGKRPRLPFTAF